MADHKIVEHDVLIIGAGGAGSESSRAGVRSWIALLTER